MKNLSTCFVFFFISTFGVYGQDIINSVVNLTPSPVAKFKKLELGVQLASTYTNPYDPEIVSVEAVFTSPAGEIYYINGFYYKDYARLDMFPYWVENPTSYSWRVRFSPNENGMWSYYVRLVVGGVVTDVSASSTFLCVNSHKPGYLKVSPNNRYLEFSNGASFFGIAEDLFAYNGQGFSTGCIPGPCSDPTDYPCYTNYAFEKYKEWIPNFANNGGNLVRIWMEPFNYELEWETLGNYDSRQYRAFDLDDVFELAEQNDVYIHFVLMASIAFETETVGNYNYWDHNPYRTFLPGGDPYQFFIYAPAKKLFKNKLRYIQARYGYSTRIATYEIMNEIDYFAGGEPPLANVQSWCNEMANYIKSFYPIHPVNVSFALGYKGEESGVNDLESIDITNGHSYSKDQNTNYQRNYYAKHHFDTYGKPFAMTEFGMAAGGGDCWVSEGKETEVQNTLWASSFSGSFSSAYYFGADAKYNNSCWGGNGIEKFKCLSNFLDDEKYNQSPLYTFEPIGNSFSTFYSYSPELNPIFSAPSEAPDWDVYGYVPDNWMTGEEFGEEYELFDGRYLAQGISTSDNKNIEVYALKSPQRIIGWINNKNYYWYYLHHTSNCPELINPNTNEADPIDFSPLINKAMTLYDLRCKGEYTIEWWSTHHNYDFNEDGILDDGGLITSLSTSSATAADGSLNVNIPKLQAIEAAEKPYAPDYGFKLILKNEAGFNNWLWHHDYTDFWYLGPDIQVDGDIAVATNDQLFYRGVGGFILHFYWNDITYKWTHDGLVTDWWTQNANYKVAASSELIINSSNQVFYRGADNRMQHYYWDGTNWVHNYTDMWDPNLGFRVGGDIAVSADNQLFYRGVDGYVQHFYWDDVTSKWTHDGLVTDWWTQDTDYKVAASGELNINSSNQVFYRGADNRMQHYYADNPCIEEFFGDKMSGYPQPESIDYNLVSPGIFLECYPNPFYSVINIKYEIVQQTEVNLSLYDIYGNMVKIFLGNEDQDAGFYFYEHNFSDLTPGIYTLVLCHNGQIVESKKLVCMK